MARKFTELQNRMSPERRAANEQRARVAIQAMPLDHLREARSLTQTQLAEVLNVSQGSVSRLERRTDVYVSTLRSYVRAMGGDIEIRAVFADGQVVTINQFQDLS